MSNIQSPLLGGSYVVFNNIGFKHLIRKAKIRSNQEQMNRFALLRDVPDIIRNPNAKIGHRIIREKNHIIQYWAFVEKKNEKTIKVVVRQVGNGIKHFYSVMSNP
jgi:hypothetical protein